ncbi:hypothetical protein ACIQGT_13930 [Streptomyces sp. NPDC093108]|uniref:hypothetical protein n=1 Tax=unclassified Streptomyces TaxID=2593676 RepID=UPI003810485A
MTVHDSSDAALLRYFDTDHLPARLAAVSAPFRALAHEMVTALPQIPERTAGLHRLLEAKDCAVRAALDISAATEGAASPEGPGGCRHCPDGHTPADRGSQPWGVWVGSQRDGDGQPTIIHVARSGGAHVAESDAEWIRARLNGARP